MVEITADGPMAVGQVVKRGGRREPLVAPPRVKVGAGRLTGPRRLILDVIEGMGGEIRDEDGGATAVVHERLTEAGHVITAKSLANALKAMEDRGMLVREVRGKRTYAIRVPTLDGSGVEGSGTGGDSRGDAGSVLGGDHHHRAGDGIVGTLTVPLTDIDRLATSLLEQVATILAREADGTESASATEIKRRLAGAIDESQRAVKKVRELEAKYDACRDELVFAKSQVKVWQTRSEQAEANIQAVVKAGGKPLDDRKLRALERFIASTPNAKR